MDTEKLRQQIDAKQTGKEFLHSLVNAIEECWKALIQSETKDSNEPDKDHSGEQN